METAFLFPLDIALFSFSSEGTYNMNISKNKDNQQPTRERRGRTAPRQQKVRDDELCSDAGADSRGQSEDVQRREASGSGASFVAAAAAAAAVLLLLLLLAAAAAAASCCCCCYCCCCCC